MKARTAKLKGDRVRSAKLTRYVSEIETPISKIDTNISEIESPIDKIDTPSGPIHKIDTYESKKQKDNLKQIKTGG